jgi:hypothetical protein
MLTVFNALGTLDLAALAEQEAEIAALDAPTHARLLSLIAASTAVTDAEAAVKQTDDAIRSAMQRREDLLRQMPKPLSASDRHTLNVRAHLAAEAARRGAQ